MTEAAPDLAHWQSPGAHPGVEVQIDVSAGREAAHGPGRADEATVASSSNSGCFSCSSDTELRVTGTSTLSLRDGIGKQIREVGSESALFQLPVLMKDRFFDASKKALLFLGGTGRFSSTVMLSVFLARLRRSRYRQREAGSTARMLRRAWS